MTAHRLPALLIAALALAPRPASAADACREDELRLCRDSIPAGRKAVDGCLEFYAIDLTPSCKNDRPPLKLKSAQDKAAFQTACGGDARALCPNSAGGWIVTVKCLTLHDEELSKDCRAYAIDLRGRLQERLVLSGRESCSGDAAKICPGKEFGGGLERCLAESAGRLTPACRKGLKILDRTEEMKRVERMRARDKKAAGQ